MKKVLLVGGPRDGDIVVINDDHAERLYIAVLNPVAPLDNMAALEDVVPIPEINFSKVLYKAIPFSADGRHLEIFAVDGMSAWDVLNMLISNYKKPEAP